MVNQMSKGLSYEKQMQVCFLKAQGTREDAIAGAMTCSIEEVKKALDEHYSPAMRLEVQLRSVSRKIENMRERDNVDEEKLEKLEERQYKLQNKIAKIEESGRDTSPQISKDIKDIDNLEEIRENAKKYKLKTDKIIYIIQELGFTRKECHELKNNDNFVELIRAVAVPEVVNEISDSSISSIAHKFHNYRRHLPEKPGEGLTADDGYRAIKYEFASKPQNMQKVIDLMKEDLSKDKQTRLVDYT